MRGGSVNNADRSSHRLNELGRRLRNLTHVEKGDLISVHFKTPFVCRSHIQIPHIQCVFLDELAAGFDLVAHRKFEFLLWFSLLWVVWHGSHPESAAGGEAETGRPSVAAGD